MNLVNFPRQTVSSTGSAQSGGAQIVSGGSLRATTITSSSGSFSDASDGSSDSGQLSLVASPSLRGGDPSGGLGLASLSCMAQLVHGSNSGRYFGAAGLAPGAAGGETGAGLAAGAVAGKTYHCQRCLNHGIQTPRKGHKRFCLYVSCTCDKCSLVEQRKMLNREINSERDRLMSPNGGDKIADKVRTRNPKCARCGVHCQDAEAPPLKGHKKNCPYQNCTCRKCTLVTSRRSIMARQIHLRRTQKAKSGVARLGAGPRPNQRLPRRRTDSRQAPSPGQRRQIDRSTDSSSDSTGSSNVFDGPKVTAPVSFDPSPPSMGALDALPPVFYQQQLAALMLLQQHQQQQFMRQPPSAPLPLFRPAEPFFGGVSQLQQEQQQAVLQRQNHQLIGDQALASAYELMARCEALAQLSQLNAGGLLLDPALFRSQLLGASDQPPPPALFGASLFNGAPVPAGSPTGQPPFVFNAQAAMLGGALSHLTRILLGV